MFDFKYSNSLEKRKNKNLLSVFLNPHSIIQYYTDYHYYLSIQKNCNFFIDGIGLYLIKKLETLTKNVYFRRITGFDYFISVINKKNYKNILLIGSSYKNLKKIKNKIIISNITHRVYLLNTPFVNEYFKVSDLKKIFKNFDPKIKIDYCFIGVGAPKQEKLANLINQEFIIKKKFNFKNIVCIGAVFDFYISANYKIYLVFKKLYLEWFYRFFTQPKIWKRIFISFPLFLWIFFNKIKPTFIKINLLKKPNRILLNKKKFILSALNLACYSYIFKKVVPNTSPFYFWTDGIFHKFLISGLNKYPGYKLISNLIIPKNIKNFHVIGNLEDKALFFLKKKYNLKTIHTPLPFDETNKLFKKLPKISKNEIVLVTLPTPKQELVANYLAKKNKDYKIICIGGGLNIASGIEKKCPKLFDKLYLESLWRLKYQTNRRLKRLLITFFIFLKSFFSLFHNGFKINVYD